MRLENDTSHEIFADNFMRNRGKNFMKLLRKSGGSHFFDSLSISSVPGELGLSRDAVLRYSSGARTVISWGSGAVKAMGLPVMGWLKASSAAWRAGRGMRAGSSVP